MTRRLTALLLLFLLAAVSGRAQDKEGIRQVIERTAAAMQTMSCNFTQTKHLKMLDEEMVSHGRMYYSHGNRLRWEYTSPYSYVFLLDGNKVHIRNEYRSDEIDIQQNRMFKEIVRIMMNSVVGRCLSDEKRFKVELSDSGEEWTADMTPLAREMKMMFAKIRIHFNKKAMMVSSVDLYERNGDRTHIGLTDIRQNEPLDDGIFSLQD